MGKNHIEILTTFGDDSSQTDNLGTCADNDYQFQLTVVLEFYIRIIKFGLFFHIIFLLYQSTYQVYPD